jgi:nucleoid-associated protein YgaU
MSQPARIVSTLRFVVGLSMVAGGVAMAAPFLVAVAAVIGRHESAPVTPARGVSSHPYAAAPAAWGGLHATVNEVPPLPDLTDPALSADGAGVPTAAGPAGFAGEVRAVAQVSIPMAPEAAALPPTDPAPVAPLPAIDPFLPPSPPEPLPRVSAELMGAGPEFTGTYRSTLDLPPPPLLDGHQPPPTQVAWSARPAEPRAVELHTIPAALVPPSYVVRDGDDLTSIATRFYGHPAAAGAIWTANRATLSDPEVLPIGSELTLPPPWTIALIRPGAGAGPAPIEPRPASAAAPRTPATVPANAQVVPVSWLGATAADAPGLATTPPVALAPAPAARPGSVRVAPGESLESLASRFYGDPAMARRIWEANRDRLRSPALVVPGMELRLP